jgi:predicted O-methyltransferase YrrM
LRTTSIAAAETIDKGVDFIFIDGDHSYEGVKADVDVWLPKLNKNALIIFHDIGWAEGVQRVVKEEIQPFAKKEGQLPNMYWAWL